MKHIYLNLKRFDVPAELGGVNRGTLDGSMGRRHCIADTAGLEAL